MTEDNRPKHTDEFLGLDGQQKKSVRVYAKRLLKGGNPTRNNKVKLENIIAATAGALANALEAAPPGTHDANVITTLAQKRGDRGRN